MGFMEHQTINFTVFLIFAGAAVFSTIALYLRQSLLVAYMLFGVVFGSWGFKVIPDIDLIHKIDSIGVIFLMFLLGLQLQPHNLLRLVSKTAWVSLTSSLIFFVVGFAVGYWYDYSLTENLVIGACMMFSSTIVSLKLLPPTSVAKRQPVSEIMISILLLQDLIAILVLLAIEAARDNKLDISEIITLALALPAIWLFVFLAERFVLKKIFVKFSEVQEYVFLVAIAWCFGVAQLADSVGFTYEIGAFVAGLALSASSSPVVLYIFDQLKPLRDFFLVLFFFIIGASFNLQYLKVIIIPALILTTIFILLKPIIFRFLLCRINECKNMAWELGVRLSQLSEFSFLVVFCAGKNGLINDSVAYLIQAVTMIMFIISSYLVAICYPTKKSIDQNLKLTNL